MKVKLLLSFLAIVGITLGLNSVSEARDKRDNAGGREGTPPGRATPAPQRPAATPAPQGPAPGPGLTLQPPPQRPAKGRPRRP